MALVKRRKTSVSRLSFRSAALSSGDDKVLAINTPPSVKVRQGGRKNARFVVSIDATPLVHDFGALKLNGAPAEAIREQLVARLKRVGQGVKPATIERRNRYVGEFARGRKAAMDHFGAARTRSGALRKGSNLGDSPPSFGRTRALNFSGRLADSLAARWNPRESEWTINTAANRFNPTLFGTPAAFARFLQQWESYVQPRRAVDSDAVREAVKGALDDALIRQLDRNAALQDRLRKARLNLFKQVGGLFLRATLGA